jgi:5-methylcytosine-specific restriction endonuclease McrA
MTKSKARLELDKDREFLLQLYDNKCIVCGTPTNVLHEIIPVSHGKVALHMNNRVTLCQVHHENAHAEGTRNSIPPLQAMRRLFLMRKFGLDE